MADVDTYTKGQQLVKEHSQANPSKCHTNYLYKAFVVIIFLVIIPLFPSQAPEFINQSLLTRSWELLHLLFVGIAVSYGLFSRRNDETEKEHNNNYNNQSKFDSVQSFVSRFLQVSSVFDDEAETLSGSDETKVQTWSSLYHRNESPVIVAKEHAVLDDNTSSSPRNPEKPLLLPVRSLRSRVLNETGRGNSANSNSLSRSNSGLSTKRFSTKGTNGELRGSDQETLVEKWSDNNVVLPSPIPWRSRSARMEMKEDIESRSFKRSQSNRLSQSNSMSSSPKKSASPLPPSTEVQAKSAEDFVKKKSIYRSPPPPPPPPPMIHKPSSLKPVSPLTRNGEIRNGINGKAVRFDQTSSRTEKLVMQNPTFMEFPQQENAGKFVVETSDDDSESEGETPPIVSSTETRPINEEANQSSGCIDGGSDVDKKADEFIAKVREQIRLQRIDSIKRSSGQFKRSSTSC
ncbi:hypothetical protein E1A91_A12G232000v1 [Gossypium mustelinum]|uniref:DUF4408 domain-containing protein n=1 Tax=Gossypium mustelinum TaxID=34275 RepID=A0A5D2WXY1_GOSMU|nr:hypothetical protein E1A91_A12G232000v1 [Gossypium mustelinum]